MTDDENGPSRAIDSSRQVIEIGNRRFIIDTENAHRIVNMARRNDGWAHVGPYLVHLAGAVVGPFAEGDVPEGLLGLQVQIDSEDHENFRVVFEGVFG